MSILIRILNIDLMIILSRWKWAQHYYRYDLWCLVIDQVSYIVHILRSWVPFNNMDAVVFVRLIGPLDIWVFRFMGLVQWRGICWYVSLLLYYWKYLNMGDPRQLKHVVHLKKLCFTRFYLNCRIIQPRFFVPTS